MSNEWHIVPIELLDDVELDPKRELDYAIKKRRGEYNVTGDEQ